MEQNMRSEKVGGIVHVYQKFNPSEFPSPTSEPPDLVSGAFEHALTYGSYRQLTEEELANAVRLDPSQIAGLGPSLDSIRKMLEERKRKILETYSIDGLDKKATQRFEKTAKRKDHIHLLTYSPIYFYLTYRKKLHCVCFWTILLVW